MKHIGTNKEKEYSEAEVMDEVFILRDGELVKAGGEDECSEKAAEETP